MALARFLNFVLLLLLHVSFFSFYLDADLEKIQVDPINRKLFYADTGNNLIGSINLDGTGYRVVVNQSLDEPRDLALVPATQWEYINIIVCCNGEYCAFISWTVYNVFLC